MFTLKRDKEITSRGRHVNATVRPAGAKRTTHQRHQTRAPTNENKNQRMRPSTPRGQSRARHTRRQPPSPRQEKPGAAHAYIPTRTRTAPKPLVRARTALRSDQLPRQWTPGPTTGDACPNYSPRPLTSSVPERRAIRAKYASPRVAIDYRKEAKQKRSTPIHAWKAAISEAPSNTSFGTE